LHFQRALAPLQFGPPLNHAFVWEAPEEDSRLSCAGKG